MERRFKDYSAEMLTIEQFAERVQVSRSTVFSWMKQGLLVEGRHYFKIGAGTLRFPWGPEYLERYLKDSHNFKSNTVQREEKPLTNRIGIGKGRVFLD